MIKFFVPVSGLVHEFQITFPNCGFQIALVSGNERRVMVTADGICLMNAKHAEVQALALQAARVCIELIQLSPDMFPVPVK